MLEKSIQLFAYDRLDEITFVTNLAVSTSTGTKFKQQQSIFKHIHFPIPIQAFRIQYQTPIQTIKTHSS